MERSDYRIGNLIRNRAGRVCKISEMLLAHDELYISIRCQPTGEMNENISPIPLTPEILESNGFVRDFNGALPNQPSFSNGPLILNGEFRLCTNYNGGISIVSKKLEFVHELQNLYASITGKDLEMTVE